MALVYTTKVIPYAAKVQQSIDIPLFPRIRRTKMCVYSLLGPVRKSVAAVYDIINYLPVSGSVSVPYAGRVRRSINAPYKFEFGVLQSISIPYAGQSRVIKSTSIDFAIPGYTMVSRSTRVLVRFEDQTLIQPSVTVRVSK